MTYWLSLIIVFHIQTPPQELANLSKVLVAKPKDVMNNEHSLISYYCTSPIELCKHNDIILTLLTHTPILFLILRNIYNIVNIKKLLISKRRIGILKKLPKQGEDSESL